MKFKIRGVSPLLMHNEQLADPLNEFSQQLSEISGKRQKTLEDHKEMSRIEWFGGLYLTGDPLVPCVPAVMMEACIRDGAKKKRKGKDVTAGLMVLEDAPVLIGNASGTIDIEKLWLNPHFRDRRGVVVGRAKIFRTRPVFKLWELDIEVQIDSYILEEKDVVEYLELAGRYAGLGDWRPRFGRFTATRA